MFYVENYVLKALHSLLVLCKDYSLRGLREPPFILSFLVSKAWENLINLVTIELLEK